MSPTIQAGPSFPLTQLRSGAPPSLPDSGSHARIESQHKPLPNETSEKEGGRQAWLVVFGASAMFFITLGLIYSFGVIQTVLISRQFASSSTLGWVSSVTVVQMPLFAIPCTQLVQKLGNQKTGLIGALLVGTGYLTTSWCFTSVPALFVAQAIFGCGYAVVFWSCNSIAASYFTKKRALVTGIVYSASGLGGAIFSIVLQKLTSQVGLEWSVRIYGILAYLVLIPASFTLQPCNNNNNNNNKTVPSNSAVVAFRLSLFQDFRFNLLMLAIGLSTFALFVPPFFLPTYAFPAQLSTSIGAWLVTGYNLASALGRVMFGVLADSRVGPVTTLFFVLFLSSLSMLAIWTVANSLSVLIVFIILNGSCSGALLSLQPPVNASVFGIQQTALTMSMITSSRAFGSALGGPVAGYLLDAFGGPWSGTKAYQPALLVMGTLCLVSASSVSILRYRLAGWKLDIRV